MISLFAHTQSSYVNACTELLSKGRQHAALFYEEIIRKGTPPAKDHPAFRTAGVLYDKLFQSTHWELPTLKSHQTDGSTGKFLLQTAENLEIESVLIPMQSGGTLCISSQVGCRMGCSFCETGRMGLLRSLRTEEIVAQVFIARHRLGFQFQNIVFMGMGEPFDNYDAVLQAARIFIDPKAFGFGKRNVTLSTSGRVEEIRRFAREEGDTPNLAVSITAADDALRTKLMPINRKHNLQELYTAMQEYNQRTGRQILVACVLLAGINDTPLHAEWLATYLQGLDVKINLIPYNPQSNDPYQPPTAECFDHFADLLRVSGYQTLKRTTKGRSIMAGCGQLGNLQHRRQRNAPA